MKKKWNISLGIFLLLLLLGVSNMTVWAQDQEKTEQKAAMSSASVVLSAPVMKSVTAVSYRTLKITWGAVNNATSYEVFRRENGRWVKLGETSKIYYSHISSDAHKIEPGVPYRYSVRAIYRSKGKVIKGKAAKVTLVGKTSLAKVSGLKATALNDEQIQISWKKVTGATQYWLYRKDTKGNWQLIKKFGAQTTSYVHTSWKNRPISAEKTYTYTVRAYAKTSKGMLGGARHTGVRVKTPKKKFSKIIMIGHSRALGMKQAITPQVPTEWYAKVSAGYTWLSSYVMPSIIGSLNRDTAVVIMMGVNDVYQQKNYVSYLNSQIDSWKNTGASFYYVGIGPVTYDPYVTNGEICTFNNYLKNNLRGIKFIDSYSYLMSNGFYTTDGAHYNNDTYRRQYNYIMNSL